jgi:alanine dehydrogenase
MKVGIPAEVKNHEYRVAITPVGVHELVGHGHEVIIQKGAGLGSSITTTTTSARARASSSAPTTCGARPTWSSRSRSRSPRSTTGCARV